MPQVTVQLYRIPVGYFGSGAVSVQDELTVTIDDDDTVLHANETADPGSSQVFSSTDHSLTSYQMVFDTTFQWTPPGATSPETISAKVVALTVDGVLGYYLMAEDGSSIPDLSTGSTIDRIGHSSYTPIEYDQIACFVAGTMIETPSGMRAVEDIQVGDLVITQDHGPQAVRWIGTAHLAQDDLVPRPELLPIRVSKGALGPNLPSQDLYLSPEHRLLLSGWRVELFFGEAEVLTSVKHLLNWPGIDIAEEQRSVSYYHLMFDRHEIIQANGLGAESFYLGDQIREGLEQEQIDEIIALFPELETKTPKAARRFAKPFELAAMA